MPRILVIIINALVKLVDRVMLIYRSFPLALDFRYFSYFSHVLEIDWLGSFSGIYFRNSFIIIIISLFYGIFCL